MPGAYVGFRASGDLKDKLAAAAAESGRSLSAEAQFRLEQSFRDTGHVLDALPMAFGRELAGLLIGLGQVMKWTGDYARYAVTGKPGDDWMIDADAFSVAKEVAVEFLNKVQPPGELGALAKVLQQNLDITDDLYLLRNHHETLLRKVSSANDPDLTNRARELLTRLREKHGSTDK